MSAWPCLPYIESRIQALEDGKGALQGHLAVEQRRSLEAQRDVEALENKLLQEQRNLDAAKEELHRLHRRETEAVRAIKAAAAAVQRLTRQQLDEVRCLAQPPVVVKRALSLVHAILHPEDISLDDPELLSDWEKLSAMLRRSLLQHIADFPPPQHPLSTHPHVRELISSQIEDAELHSSGARPHSTAVLKKALKLSKNEFSKMSGPPSARGKPPRLSFAVLAEAALRNQCAREEARRGRASPRPEEDAPDPPRLTQHSVSFACRPVGILFRWLVQQVRFAEALLKHEENAEKEEKQLKDAEAAVKRLQDALASLRNESDEAKARGQEASTAVTRLGSELGAAEEEERGLREQREVLQRKERRKQEFISVAM